MPPVSISPSSRTPTSRMMRFLFPSRQRSCSSDQSSPVFLKEPVGTSIPHTTPPITPSIPQEIIEAIVDSIALRDDYLSRQCLLQCSLASKSFLGPSRSHLFKKIQFTPLCGYDVGPVSRAKSLLTLLQSSKLIWSAIKPMEISQHVRVVHIHEVYCDLDLASVLQLLTNVRVLCLTYSRKVTWHCFDPSLQAALVEAIRRPQLEDLGLVGIADFPIRSIATSGGLGKLLVKDCDSNICAGEASEEEKEDHSDAADEGQASCAPRRLEVQSSFGVLSSISKWHSTFGESVTTLVLHVDRSSDVAYVEGFLARVAPHLRHLQITGSEGYYPFLELNHYTDLESLELGVETWFQEARYGLPPCVLKVVGAIQKAPHLASLRINVSWIGCNPSHILRWGESPQANGITEWENLDQALAPAMSLKHIEIISDISFDNGQLEWGIEEVILVERAVEALQEITSVLLPGARAKPGKKVVVRGGMFVPPRLALGMPTGGTRGGRHYDRSVGCIGSKRGI